VTLASAGTMPALLAAAGGDAHSSIPALLLTLAAVILATKLLGEVAQRLGQPAVLGELLAGILLGGSVLGLLDPANPVVAALSEIGVLVLLFSIGLHTDIASLRKVGGPAVTVALVGVVLPFAAGYGAATALGVAMIPALVCGAALTATSIGISARVLSDLGRLDTPDGQVVLGAAVLDDIVGLVILAVVSQVAAGGSVGAFDVVRTSSIALGFVVVALALGSRVVPPVFQAVEQIRISGALGLIALAFAFALAVAADRAGSAMIVGAFAAGLILHPTQQRRDIEQAATELGHFFVPIFFAAVGAAVDLRALADARALLVGAALIVVGILGKVAAGYAPVGYKGDKLLVGVAMVPRGEVGLIFAQMGLATGAIAADLFGAIMLMVLATTLVTPPLLGVVARRRVAVPHAAESAPVPDVPGDGGIDDLVAGTSLHEERRRAARDTGRPGPS
jgi:Kef-type K+ transport system membrane component KefB